MKKFINNLINKYDLHDIDLIIIKDRKIVSEFFQSNSNIEINPIKRHHLYRVASLSKLFVGISIMQLHEQKLLNINDNIEAYIPFSLRNINHKDKIITIKHLLTHTSGLQDTDVYHVPYNEHSKELFTKTGKYYSDNMYSKYKPGERIIYYNAGFHLLALTIEKITNIRFDHYIEKHILTPLNMNGSFNVSLESTQKHIRATYRKTNNKWVPQQDFNLEIKDYSDYSLNTNGSLFSPQGGLRSNAKELSKLMLDLMSDNPKILAKETINYMQQIHHLDHHTEIQNPYDFYTNMGITFNIISSDSINKPIKNLDQQLVGHYGIAYGFHGIFFYNPLNNNGIIFNVTGEGKPLKEYLGNHSQFYQFQEDIFEYVKKNIW